MKNRVVAFSLGGGEMLVSLKKGKSLILLAALLVGVALLAVPALAACPPGTIDLSNPNNYVSVAGVGAPIDNLAVPATKLQQAGTYCIPVAGIVLGGLAPAPLGFYPTEFLVAADDITIVGEGCCARLTGSGASANLTASIIEVPVASSNTVIHNLIIEDGGPIDQFAINSAGESTIIESVTFDGVSGANFANVVIALGGDYATVESCLFDMAVAGSGICIQLNFGDTERRIVNNIVQGSLVAGSPLLFVQNNQPTADDVDISNNIVKGGVGFFIGPAVALVNSFEDSIINDNIASCAFTGIDLGNNTRDTTVEGNEILYGDQGMGRGLIDAGGDNIHYVNNAITASSSAASVSEDGIQFLSSGALIDGNIIDARGAGSWAGSNGDGIDATGGVPGGIIGADEAKIVNNTIRGTSWDGTFIGGLPSGGYGIRMDNAGCSDVQVGYPDDPGSGNDIRNTATAGIAAVALVGPPVGGDGHKIVFNTISHTGTALTESLPPALIHFPYGTAIATNGGCSLEPGSYSDPVADEGLLCNEISNVRAGYGIFSRGDEDQIVNNKVQYLSDSYGSGIHVEENTSKALIWGNTVGNVTGVYASGIGIAGEECTIEKNTIDTVTGQDGIKVYDSAYVAVLPAPNPGDQTITDNTIRNIPNGVGINLTDNDDNTVRGNHIENTGREGILLYSVPNIELSHYPGVPGPLLLLPGPPLPVAEKNVIENNSISNAARDAADVNPSLAANVRSQRYAGIGLIGNVDENVVGHVSDGTLGNTIQNAGSLAYAVGIDLTTDGIGTPDENKISYNTVDGFTHVSDGAVVSEGIRVVYGEDNTVTNNTVTNSGALQLGIAIWTKMHALISDNWVEGMQAAGLYLAGGSASDPLDVKGNRLVSNARGIWMADGAANVNTCNLIAAGNEALYVDALANAARFHVNGNCIGTCVLIRNMGIGTLDAENNYWASEPISNVNVYGLTDTTPKKSSCTCNDWEEVLGSAATGCHSYEYGWNLVSVPVNPNSPSATAVFGQYSAGLRAYNTATGKFYAPSTVSWDEGYWLLMPSKDMICFHGTTVTGEQQISLAKAGWHLIGVPFPCRWGNTVVTPTNTALPPIGWDAVAQDWEHYSLTTELGTHLGFWVYTLQDNVTLTFPYPQTGVPTTSAASMASLAELPNGMLPPLPPSISDVIVPGEDLIFTNDPNPITDVHTTTFMVKGTLASRVEAVKVEIFDLSGQLVYESEEVPGTSLDWHTDNDYGEYLANGVYLYKLSALLDGVWVTSSVKTLVILR